MSVLLAKSWAGSDPTGWWISEKLDGVRAVWDGYSLTTRTGQPIHAPQWWLESLPAFSLDGELWIGRGKFQQTVSVARSHNAGDAWRSVRFAVFDAPSSAGVFEDRQSVLAACLPAGVAFVVTQTKCDGRAHLLEQLASVEAMGGEGLMLRKPGSMYEPKRSATLLKVKTFADAEATVIGYEAGTGRNRLTIGALVARMQDGKTFRVSSGLSDAMRQTPPAIGTVFTYQYQELTTAGVPRFPSFLRVA